MQGDWTMDRDAVNQAIKTVSLARAPGGDNSNADDAFYRVEKQLGRIASALEKLVELAVEEQDDDDDEGDEDS